MTGLKESGLIQKMVIKLEHVYTHK